MAKDFTIPPVIFTPTQPNPHPTHPHPNPQAPTPNQSHLSHRRPPSAPFQPPNPSPSSLPFMSFDISSATTSSTASYPPTLSPSLISSLDEPPLLEELEINPSLILKKTISLLNPLNPNPSLHSDPDLSGPFLYYMAFSLFQLLNGKVQFGVILGWIAISSIFLYSVLNFLAGKNGTLDLYRCVSVVGYCLLPILMFSALNLFLPPNFGFAVAAVFVVWATRVCSRLLAEDELGIGAANEHRGLIAYPCFLIYSLFTMLVMF